MKIVVTGGCGFIGSHLVESLVAGGHKVVIIDNLSTGSRKNIEHIEKKYELQVLDLAVPDRIYGTTGKVDCIVHLSALPRVQFSIDSPRSTHDANVNATFNILEFARAKKVKKFIYASSSSVYGDQKELPLREHMRPNPLNPYALQKFIGEAYCRMWSKIYGMHTVSLRFFNVYGSRMATEGAYKLVFANWIESIRKGETMKIFGDGKQTRDFTHVRDVVQAIISAIYLDIPILDPVFNVGSGVETSILELAKLFGHPYEHVEARSFEEQRKVADLTETQKYLAYVPFISIKTGVEMLKKEYAI